MHRIKDPRREWVRKLPSSKMVFPETLGDQAKFVFWFAIRPYHRFLRDSLISLGLIDHSKYVSTQGRQKYLFGKLAPEVSIEQFVDHLVSLGFGNHFIAWKDSGEIVGLRLVRDFRHQYHIRIFEDGEVRTHYEYTTEYRPIKHLHQVGQEERREEFAPLLEGWVVPVGESESEQVLA